MFFTKFKVSNAVKTSRWALCYLLFCIAFCSCSDHQTQSEVKRSVYHWKSVFRLTNFELNRLDSLRVKTIYLKFFDVTWDDLSSQAKPTAKLTVTGDENTWKYTIVPTVFITNECFTKTDSTGAGKLAAKTYRLIQDICSGYHINDIHEIQIDCDWTAATRQNYFIFLRAIRQAAIGKNVSVTIRLHQVKYRYKTGIPPADRGMLMCYNMGNLKNAATRNSIIETEELKRFTGNLSSYPLPLDVALPLFNWQVLFRNKVYKGLLTGLEDRTLSSTSISKNDHLYTFLKDTSINGYLLKKGDVLRSETSETSEVLTAAGEINKQLKNPGMQVALYHLDSLTLSKYPLHELEELYSSFR